MVSTRGVLPGLWLKIRLEMLPFVVSWCRGFHSVVSTRDVVVSTLWCLAGLWLKIRLEMLPFVVSWFPPRSVVVSTPWCRGVHPVVLWFPPRGVVVSCLVFGSKLDWKCCTPWCRGFHLSWCRGVLPGLWLEIRLKICLRGFP